MELAQRVQAVRERIAAAATAAGRSPEEITLCAATKVQTDDTIRAAIAAGIQVCGENRVQELTAHLAADAYAGARGVHFIGHLQTNKVKQVVGRVDLIQSVDSPHVRLRGLMAIPPISTVPGGNRRYFAEMYQLFIDIREKKYDNEVCIDCLSMGMSDDFEEAVAHGSTLVRIGTALFGKRPPMRAQG